MLQVKNLPPSLECTLHVRSVPLSQECAPKSVMCHKVKNVSQNQQRAMVQKLCPGNGDDFTALARDTFCLV